MKAFFISALALGVLFSCSPEGKKPSTPPVPQDKTPQAAPSAQASNSLERPLEVKNLVGIWQADNPIMAAGWSDNYQFFSDGTYRFNFTQMGEANRTPTLFGQFSLSGNTLTLRQTGEVRIEGGEIEQGSPGESIINGQIKQVTLPEPVVTQHTLKGITLKTLGKKVEIQKWTLIMDEREFYLMKTDPAKY